MRSHDNEKGFALILLIGITAALAILAATMVMMLANQQWGTAKERSAKTALYYSEAALNSAATALESDNSWLTTPFTTTSDMTEMGTNYGSLSGAPTVTYLVYDNQNPVNYSVNWDANGDGAVWVQTTTTYVNRTTTVRELVKSQKSSSVLPYAAAWTDTDMTLNNTSNIYGVNLDGTPDTSGAPYATTVMCGGDFTGNSSTTLASPADSTHTQSLGLQVNGNVTTPGHNFNPVKGGVGMLSDYFDQAHQAALMNLAQTAMSSSSSLFDLSPPTVCTTSAALLAAMTYNSTTKTYTASGDLEYNNTSTTLTLNTAGTTYNFQKLYVNGALTLSGNVTVSCTSLYVNGAFTESGATSAVTDQFGPVYCAKTITWKGGSTSSAPLVTIKTTSPTTTTVSGTVMASPTVAGPMFAKILSIDGDSSSNSDYDGSSGAWNITLGYVWIDGDAGTGDVAVNFSGPSGTASQLYCPVLATTEQTHSNGLVNCGSLTQPMVYFMQCDNDGLYSNTCEWASTGTYTGLMILFEAAIEITGSSSVPNVVGAVLEGTPVDTDITMSGSADICYNQTVINNIGLDSIMTTTIQPVPGSWQQLKGT
ncbi:MAG: hypothetical protein ABR941_12125 [Thermoleophilia bacterium]